MNIDQVMGKLVDIPVERLRSVITGDSGIKMFMEETEYTADEIIDLMMKYHAHIEKVEEMETEAGPLQQSGGSSTYNDDLGDIIFGLDANDPLQPEPFIVFTPSPDYSTTDDYTIDFSDQSIIPEPNIVVTFDEDYAIHIEDIVQEDDEIIIEFPSDVEPPAPEEDDTNDDDNEQDDDNSDGNRGHGNNHDGQDDDNPGKGKGGPNKCDKDGDDEDEGSRGNQDDTTPGVGNNPCWDDPANDLLDLNNVDLGVLY